MSQYHHFSPPLHEIPFMTKKIFLFSFHSTYLLFYLLTARAGAGPAGVFLQRKEKHWKATQWGRGWDVTLRSMCELWSDETCIPCNPALHQSPHQTCALQGHRSRRPCFEPPSQPLLPDAQHRPMVCRYYGPKASDTQGRVTSAQGAWASAVFASGLIFLPTREHSNTTYGPGVGCWC